MGICDVLAVRFVPDGLFLRGSPRIHRRDLVALFPLDDFPTVAEGGIYVPPDLDETIASAFGIVVRFQHLEQLGAGRGKEVFGHVDDGFVVFAGGVKIEGGKFCSGG